MGLAKIISIFRRESETTHQPIQPETIDTSEQRLCPRVQYKEEMAPFLHLGEKIYRVIDLSKTGVRFLVDNENILGGSAIEGTIRIIDGTCIRFRGSAIREDASSGVVAVQFMQTEYLVG